MSYKVNCDKIYKGKEIRENMEEMNTLDKILLGTAGGFAVIGGYITFQVFRTYLRLRSLWEKCAEIRAINAEHESNRLSLREYQDSLIDY